MTKQLAFHVNLAACSGCKACQVACKDKNDLEVGQMFRRVVEYSGGTWMKSGAAWLPGVFTYNVSLACMHCEHPACVDACPTGGITKRDDGIVLIDPDKCIGCRYCEWNCPYGALQFDDSVGLMRKCDFCQDYLAQGKAPACVSACPMRALDYGELSELRSRYGTLAAVAPLPEPTFTFPSIVLTPHRDSQPTGSTAGKVANEEEI
jgi:anaerobic dimethyl sulfoxide reductase subunit B